MCTEEQNCLLSGVGWNLHEGHILYLFWPVWHPPPDAMWKLFAPRLCPASIFANLDFSELPIYRQNCIHTHLSKRYSSWAGVCERLTKLQCDMCSASQAHIFMIGDRLSEEQ